MQSKFASLKLKPPTIIY